MQAIGVGALTSAASSGIGYAGNRVSDSLSKSFEGNGSNKSGDSNDAPTSENKTMTTNDAQVVLNDQDTVNNLADDELFAEDIDGLLDGTVNGVQNAETFGSFEPEEVPPE